MESFYTYYYPTIIVLALVFSVILFIRRKSLYNAYFLMFMLLTSIVSSLFNFLTLEEASTHIHPVNNLLYCSLAVAVVGPYSINMQLPGWLNLRRELLLLLFPLASLLIILCSFFSGLEFSYYSNYSECIEHIGEYQVWIRFVLIAILWIQYWVETVIPRMTIHNYDGPLWFDLYAIVFFMYHFSFGITAFCPSEKLRLVQNLYICAFTIAVTVVEVFTHITDPKRINITTQYKQDYEKFLSNVNKDSMDYVETLKECFYRIEGTVMEKKLYTKPHLTIWDVSSEAKVPKDMVNNAIAAAGYSGYNHFIAKCRVVALKDLLLENNGHNILDLYNQVGFINRTTAAKYFKMFNGLTPTDWYKQKKRSLYSR